MATTIVPARTLVCRVRRRCVSTFDEIDQIETIDMTDRVLASGRVRGKAAVAVRFELSLPAGSGTGPARWLLSKVKVKGGTGVRDQRCRQVVQP